MIGISSKERNAALITYLLTAPFGWLGALIGWLVWKSIGTFANKNTTEALNFGITTLIGYLVIGIASHLISFLGLLGGALWVAQLVLCIIAALAAYKGESYRFPFSLRLIK